MFQQKITYQRDPTNSTGLTAYVDADWAASLEDRKSISGYVIYLFNQIISWRTIKQKSISLSTMESEYVAISEAAKELLWLKRILQECAPLGCAIGTPTIYSDSQAAIAFTNSRIENARNRHIDIRYHFVKDLVDRGEMLMSFIPSKGNIADMFTKPLPKPKFEELRDSVIQC